MSHKQLLFEPQTVEQRLFRREICGNVGSSSTRSLYGSKAWVDTLDITNELYGHTGCVNALSWSRSGNLLASGSDDKLINIHTTTPSFNFNTSIETGHTANIFSVKFMPYSDDRKIVSCAGDWEVRVFDIEYAPTSNALNNSSNSARNVQDARIRFRTSRYGLNPGSVPKPAKLYTPSEAAVKVYTSHTDRVKRIVTENSPYLFLTCSEDGEVRQFDLRQPSSYYSRGNDGDTRSRASLHLHYAGIDILAGSARESDDRNPPLISYKKQRIDLNTISCSVGQPHYIALGGAHTHCFLHDRRMLGRDLTNEWGQPSRYRESELSAATRCVRRFTPPQPSSRSGLRRMRDDGHITACKISDANPDEIVVSWSSDNIYLFDINRSPETPGYPEAKLEKRGSGEGKVRNDRSRKGKEREMEDSSRGSSACLEHAMGGRKRKRSEDGTKERIGSGVEPRQSTSREISQAERGEREEGVEEPGHSDDIDTEVPGQSVLRIAALLMDLRKELFGTAISWGDQRERSWQSALSLAKVCIQRMDDIIDKYKADDSEQECISTSGYKRARSRRFVQAAGALAYALGGRLRTTSPTSIELAHKYFGQVQGDPGPDDNWRCGVKVQGEELGWRYSFIQLIVEYIKSGPKGVGLFAAEKGFGMDLMEEGDEYIRRSQEKLFEAMDEWQQDAVDNTPIMDVDIPTEVTVEGGEQEAWRMFREVAKFSSERDYTEDTVSDEQKDFWGIKIARALLLREGEEIDFAFVDSIFDTATVEEEEERKASGSTSRRRARARRRRQAFRYERDEGEEEVMNLGDYLRFITRNGLPDDDEDEDVAHQDDEDDEDEHGDEEGGNDTEDDDDEDEDEDSEEEGFLPVQYRRLKRRAARVEAHAPLWNHIRSYSGHCNVQTVKDVNFYGRNDEYVVSGSDCGNVFIWDKKTSKLVQLLWGDHETVNVVVGHPYEPKLAVSGIDNTVKIFSPDQAAQAEFFGKERSRGPRDTDLLDISEMIQNYGEEGSRKRLHDEYRIRSQNDARRDKGAQEALVTRSLLEDLAARLRRRQQEGEDISTFATGNGCVIS